MCILVGGVMKQSRILANALITGGLVCGLTGLATAQSQRAPNPILNAMQGLESARDAKCHSTACRLEDFIFGTPLSVSAREAKVDLQREFIRGAWRDASNAARDAGLVKVSPELASRAVEATMTSKRHADGTIVIHTKATEPLTISAIRVDQYASIAYSLRTILSVQQDALFSGELFVPLSPEAVDVFKKACDEATMAALMLADRESRLANEQQVPEPIMRSAWSRITGQGQVAAAPDVGAEGNRQQAVAVLQGLIRSKLAAYQAYNEIEQGKSGPLLLSNVQSYYARYPLVKDPQERARLLSVFRVVMSQFVNSLIGEAEGLAEADGRGVIRAADAELAVQRLLPARVDEFEDVHFFPRFEVDRQVTLESYDCDSFRDLGLHWIFLVQAYKDTANSPAPLDPFAAEIITEAVSGYGVLIFRIAGEVARERGASETLQLEDLAGAQARIRSLATQHDKTEDRGEQATLLASTKTEARESLTAYFSDATSTTGIDFLHRSSKWLGEFRRTRLSSPPTFSGGGVASEDVNNDGHLDLLFVGGAGNRLYLGDGHGRFNDITDQAGIDWQRADGQPGEARQPIIADFDNDGVQDILITYANDANRLYRGLGDAKFEDVTPGAGLAGENIIAGAATTFDYDADGLLDIYISTFGDYLAGEVPMQDRDSRNALPNILLRNLGGMRFEDVTEQTGTGDTGWVQAVSHYDFDDDGDQDIYIANDFGRNIIFENLGNGSFRNASTDMGLTKAHHSMNVGIGNLNDDAYPDVYVSNITTMVKDNKYVLPAPGKPLNFKHDSMATMLVKESNVLFMSRSEKDQITGYDESTNVERGESSTGWAWDAEFMDFDLDGDDDLYVLNGANEYFHWYTSYHDEDSGWHQLDHDREANVFYENDGGMLRNRSSASGADFFGNSRSGVYLDMDSDGDLDIAINNFHANATVLRNDLDAPDRNWLKIRLIGDPAQGSNRDAIGAKVLITTDTGIRAHRYLLGGSGFLSMEPRLIHVGLNDAKTAKIAIHWPNGEQQTIEAAPAGEVLTIHQGGAPEDQARVGG